MPTQLTWNRPGLTWNQPGTVWNGFIGSNSKHTMKAKIDFSQYSAAELGPIAQHIHDQLVLNAASFPALPITVGAFQTLITTYGQKLAAKNSRATSDVVAFNAARQALEDALNQLGTYVNLVAKGDPTLVDKSGIPSYETGRTPSDTTPPAAPKALKLTHGIVSGSVDLRYTPDRSPSMNEVQINTGNPNTEADWKPTTTYSGGKATLTGLTPGVCLWVRVRTLGIKGVQGAWSDPAEIMVA